MSEGKNGKLWALLVTALLITIAVSGYFVWRGLGPRPVEIKLARELVFEGEIYIGGNVTSPGYYPFRSGDSIAELVRSAGGTGSEDGRWKLYVSEPITADTPQLININRAEAWLLKTLPGIGDTRAKAIVDYRTQNGNFHNINGLTNVPGIGLETLAGIKDLITVAD